MRTYKWQKMYPPEIKRCLETQFRKTTLQSLQQYTYIGGNSDV